MLGRQVVLCERVGFVILVDVVDRKTAGDGGCGLDLVRYQRACHYGRMKDDTVQLLYSVIDTTTTILLVV